MDHDNIPFVATMIPLIKNMATTFGGSEAIMPLCGGGCRSGRAWAATERWWRERQPDRDGSCRAQRHPVPILGLHQIRVPGCGASADVQHNENSGIAWRLEVLRKYAAGCESAFAVGSKVFAPLTKKRLGR
jgi:hypothetical protein